MMRTFTRLLGRAAVAASITMLLSGGIALAQSGKPIVIGQTMGT